MNPIITDGEYNFYLVIFVFHEGVDFTVITLSILININLNSRYVNHYNFRFMRCYLEHSKNSPFIAVIRSTIII